MKSNDELTHKGHILERRTQYKVFPSLFHISTPLKRETGMFKTVHKRIAFSKNDIPYEHQTQKQSMALETERKLLARYRFKVPVTIFKGPLQFLFTKSLGTNVFTSCTQSTLWDKLTLCIHYNIFWKNQKLVQNHEGVSIKLLVQGMIPKQDSSSTYIFYKL